MYISKKMSDAGQDMVDNLNALALLINHVQTWFDNALKGLKEVEAKNLDLMERHFRGELEYVDAIYLAMNREQSEGLK